MRKLDMFVPWWKGLVDLSWSLGGVGRAMRTCGSLARAFRLQQEGQLAEALAEAKSVLALVRRNRRDPSRKGAEIMVLGAHLIDELASGLAAPRLARVAVEEALLVIEEERAAPAGVDGVSRALFAEFEPWLRYRLAEIKESGKDRPN